MIKDALWHYSKH